VLWSAIRALQKGHPDVVCLVYSGDYPAASKDEILAKVQVSQSWHALRVAPLTLCRIASPSICHLTQCTLCPFLPDTSSLTTIGGTLLFSANRSGASYWLGKVSAARTVYGATSSLVSPNPSLLEIVILTAQTRWATHSPSPSSGSSRAAKLQSARTSTIPQSARTWSSGSVNGSRAWRTPEHQSRGCGLK
jgi:hypothetical protein